MTTHKVPDLVTILPLYTYFFSLLYYYIIFIEKFTALNSRVIKIIPKENSQKTIIVNSVSCTVFLWIKRYKYLICTLDYTHLLFQRSR